jgi:peptidoglycan/LPS O-acetylase OafA/YrhL
MSSDTKSKHQLPSFFPDLDALRFFAFFVVFFSHGIAFLGYENGSRYYRLLTGHFLLNGDLGVNFFFVLSGFLITYLLLKEKETTGKIVLKNFYIRRVLRIFPVYFFTIFVGFFIISNLPIDGHSLPFKFKISIDKISYYALFLANFDVVKNGLSSIITVVLWSVSVEEQFYIVWPFCIFFFTKNKYLKIGACIFAISFLLRSIYPNNFLFQKYSTFSVMSDLIVGCLGAILINYNKTFLTFIKNQSQRQIIGTYLLFFILIPSRGFSHYFGETFFYIYNPFERVLFSLIFIFIILEQCFSDNSFFKYRNLKRLSNMGKFSYGLYCYHMIAIFLIIVTCNYFDLLNDKTNFYHFSSKIVLSFLLTVLFGYISFNTFERYFMRLKTKFQTIENR